VGSTWNKHHTEFAEFVARRSPKKILEIGAGTTTLATIIRQKANIESYTIVDPNVIDRGENVRIIRKLVTSDFALDERFDTVIHSHTMEHFYNPIEDLKALARLMTDDGQMIVSVPLIVNSVMDGFSNGLNFEHTYMTTISNFYPMFAAAGLHITSMCSFNPYNVFITASKERRPVLISNEYSSTHDIITRYYEQLVDDIDGINEQIKGKNPGSVYLFGAHIFSQSLINAGLSSVYCILDNDTTKHDQRLYGTPYDVQSPDVIASDAAPIVILRTGQYTAEIAEQLRTLNPNVIII
jgi:SAM-dependent methyltransferase